MSGLADVLKVGDTAPLPADLVTGGLATDQIAHEVYGKGALQLIPLARRDRSLQLTGGTLTGTLEIGSVSRIDFLDDEAELFMRMSADVNHFSLISFNAAGEQTGIAMQVSRITSEVSFASCPVVVEEQLDEPDALTRKDFVDSRITQLTQAEYDALAPADPTNMYAIIG